MKKLRRWFRSNWGWLIIGTWMQVSCAWAIMSQGGNELLTKDLLSGSGGSPVQGGNESVALSGGEPAAGFTMSNATDTLVSGYLSGWLGSGQALQLLSYQVGTTPIYDGNYQIGVPLTAAVQLNFSDQLQSATLAQGITASILLDHLGQTQNIPVAVQLNYDITGKTVILTSQGNWVGDTLYDVAVTSGLLSIDGFNVSSPVHVQFVTALDPNQENVVLHPIPQFGVNGALPSSSTPGQTGSLQMDIPAAALSAFSIVRVSQDPLNAPLRVDPQIIRDANQKATLAQGNYGAPVSITEFDGYDLMGQLQNTLSRAATMTLSYSASNGLVSGTSLLRPQTLAIWTLDETHHLWVKLPGSQLNAQAQTISAAVPAFAVLAVIGQADGSASDSFVFPNPWRPHGPNAGDGPGQTGSEASGLTFSNLPSECTITIYTLSGEKVRQFHHSDTSGRIAQEPWDGNTTHSQHVASGVYLWRVESASDGKNGKLMIIR